MLQRMIKRLRGNQGIALLSTVLIITLIILLVTVTTLQLNTTTKQVEHTGEFTDAVLIAEMGVDYYESLIRESVDSQAIYYISDLELPYNIEPLSLDEARYFEIVDVEHEITGDTLTIRYTSVGVTGKTVRKIDNEIVIDVTYVYV